MIGKRLKEARLALGYSAEQVAEFLQVSPATIYRYENGDISKLPAKFIKPLAEYLCISPAELMGWTGNHIPMDLQHFASDPGEEQLVKTYRILPEPGKDYLLQQAQAAVLLYGEKSDSVPSAKNG